MQIDWYLIPKTAVLGTPPDTAEEYTFGSGLGSLRDSEGRSRMLKLET